jgi:hypothetical protein
VASVIFVKYSAVIIFVFFCVRGARWSRGQCAWRAIAEAKQCSQWMRKLTSHRIGDQNLLSRAPPRFGRHGKPLGPAAFAVMARSPITLRG